MAFELKRRVYDALPRSLKYGVCYVPFPWLAGRAYRRVYGRGRWFDRATVDEWRAWQEEALGEVLRFAVGEVPAYQPQKAAVERHRPFDALKEFPLIGKDTVQADQERYLPKNFESIPHYETTTGGTSGNQLKIYLDDASQAMELGFMHRQWSRVDYHSRDRKATFRGVSFPNREPGIYWQDNPIYNELQFSPFHMSEDKLSLYVEELIRYQPRYFHGYPSALDILAEYVLRHDLGARIPAIKAALCGSEGATGAQRARIKKAFDTRVYTWYGHSERVVLGGECEHSDAYHSMPDYGVMEIIDDQGRQCESEGDQGEIVGTGLFNFCMPLIRYRTGDYATRLERTCRCGREWDRFADVEGRWKQEMLHGRSGARISLAAINMHGPVFERVKRFQYHQNEPGTCSLKVMTAPEFTEYDRQAIERAFRDKLGDELIVQVETVDDIPLTSRGKLKMLVSSLN